MALASRMHTTWEVLLVLPRTLEMTQLAELMEFWPAGRGDGNLNQMAGLMDMTKPDQLRKFQPIW